MPTVLVTGPTVIQNLPFSSLAVAITIASTHFTYPQRDDQAELACVPWAIKVVLLTRDSNTNSAIVISLLTYLLTDRPTDRQNAVCTTNQEDKNVKNDGIEEVQ